MIKKINVALLKPGMYIHDFDCGWLEVPFLRRSLMVTDDRMIEKITAAFIREVYIDTDRGTDVSDAPTAAEIRRHNDEDIRRIAAGDADEVAGIEKPFAEEMKRAKIVREEAQKAITQIMGDIRLGKQVDLGAVDHAAGGLVDSVFSNASALLCLSNIKRKDDYLFQHSVNVCILMIAFCRFMNTDKDTIRDMAIGALLHDLGKMKIPETVLNKEGKLTLDEFGVMKTHVMLGKETITGFSGIPDSAAMVVMQHHERHDGSGYPNSLQGDGISPLGQMASIVDVYDAITSDRCYHKGMAPAEGLRKLYEWSRHHFKKELVESFIKCVGIYPIGTLVKMESGHVGIVLEPSAKGGHLPKIRIVYNSRTQSTVAPKDIDLSENGQNRHGKIVGFEKAELLGINPTQFLSPA